MSCSRQKSDIVGTPIECSQNEGTRAKLKKYDTGDCKKI